MKNLMVLFVLLSLSLEFVYAQQFEIQRETHQLVQNREIYLNGGMRSQIGGKSRTSIKVDLPPNTVKWYYSFSTSKGKDGSKNLNLLGQITGGFVDPSGATSNLLSVVYVPEGVASLDVYLLDRLNSDKFSTKDDLYSDGFSYSPEGSVENTKQAVVEVDDIISGTVYLGLKNPSTMHAVNISLEVVAITETKIPIPKTPAQQKAELYGSLGWTAFENGEYQQCIEYCDRSLKDYRLGWVKANKGLALLVMQEKEQALKTYMDAIILIKKQPNSEYIFGEMIKDLDMALEICTQLDGVREIKQMITLQRQ